MDALDLLEQQHRDVRALLDRLAAEPSGSAGEATLDAVLRAVEAHVRVEEAYVYVACAGKIRTDDRVYEAGKEHARLLEETRALFEEPGEGEQFVAKVLALRERFASHAEAEEDVVFPKLKRALTDEELDVLGDEISYAHARVLEQEDEASPRVFMRPLAASGSMVARRRGFRRNAPSSM